MLFVAITLLTLLVVLLIIVIFEERRQRLRRAPAGTVDHLWSPKKRRKDTRIPTVLVAQYTLAEEPAEETPSKIWNISEGGVALLVTEKLPAGTAIHLEIEHPETNQSIALEGYVAWTKPLARHDSQGRRLFESGIALSDNQPEKQDHLHRLLEHLRELYT